jgi:hypothetical protein
MYSTESLLRCHEFDMKQEIFKGELTSNRADKTASSLTQDPSSYTIWFGFSSESSGFRTILRWVDIPTVTHLNCFVYFFNLLFYIAINVVVGTLGDGLKCLSYSLYFSLDFF